MISSHLAAAVVAVAAVLAGLAGPAAACSCAAQPDDVLLAQASAVFKGTPVARRDVSATATDWVFLVDEVVKPSVTTPVQVVRSAQSSAAACGFEFQLGTRYLVYGYRSDGVLSTDLCSGTRPAAQPGATTTAPPGSIPTTSTTSTTIAAIPGRLRLPGWARAAS